MLIVYFGTIIAIAFLYVVWKEDRKATFEFRKRTPWLTDESYYDIFISYKVGSCMFVREIADYLLSNGLKVWFAEYLIPLRMQYNENEFTKKYLKGIEKSKLCLLIINDDYYGSKHCRNEFNYIQDTHDTSATIKQFIGEKSPAKELEPIESFKSIQSLFEQISAKLNKELLIPKYDNRKVNKILLDCIHANHLFQFNIAGWKKIMGYTGYLKHNKVDTISPMLVKHFDGVKVKLKFGATFDPQASVRYQPYSNSVDDKEFRKEMVKFATKYFGERNILNSAGLHMFYDVNGKSHNVYSYYNVDGWTRRYSIIDFYPRYPEKNYEVIFVFEIYGDFKSYCKIAPSLDKMVETLRVYPLFYKEDFYNYSNGYNLRCGNLKNLNSRFRNG